MSPWFSMGYWRFSAGSGLSQVNPRSVWLISNQRKLLRLADSRRRPKARAEGAPKKKWPFPPRKRYHVGPNRYMCMHMHM